MLKSTLWILIFSSLFFVLSYFLLKENHSFPKLENRDYVGKAFINRRPYPLIVKSGKILALVKEGIKPKVIGKKAVIPVNNEQYVLTGEIKKGRLLGRIKLNNQRIGTWYLEKKDLKKREFIEKEELRNDKETQKQVKLAKNYHLSRNLKSKLEEKLEKINSNNKLISKISKKEDASPHISKNLNKGTHKGKLEIKKEFNAIEAENKKLIGKIQKKHAQLFQVNRISKKGRLLEFNKRTTRRENSWYLINWGQFNNYEYEIQAAKKLGISRASLRKKLNLAQKYLNTKTSIRKEKDLIANLRDSQGYPREIKTRVERTQTNRGTTREVPRKIKGKKKKSFWKKVGDIFR